VLLLAVLVLFFPFMLFLRIVFDLDFKLKIHRYATQWIAFVVARLGIFRVAGVCPVRRTSFGVFPFINCQSCELATGACPLGTFQMSLLNREIPVLVIGQVALVGITTGRLVCGWLCPYGFLSDIFGKLSRRKLTPDLRWTHIRWAVLAVFLGSSVAYFFRDRSDVLLYCSYLCPAGFYYGVLEYALTTGLHSLLGQFPFVHLMLAYHFAMGAAVILGSIKLGGRFFCKYACPLGAVLGLFSRIAYVGLVVNGNKCRGCKACKKVCPMGITPLNRKFLSRSLCILCGRCARICPTGKIKLSFQPGGLP
jgi:polyferredoxin